MPHVSIRHTFDCDEETFWQVSLFDEVYSRRLYLETLRFPKWRILEQNAAPPGLRRRVEIQPRLDNVPGPLQPILGDGFGYIEEGTFDQAARRYSYRMIPNTMPDKTRIAGTMYTEGSGDGRCVRTVEFDIDVKVMIVGRLVEQRTIEDTRSTHERITAFTQAYLRDRKGSIAPA